MAHHIHILVERVGQTAKVPHGMSSLLLLSFHPWWQQPVDAQGLPLLYGEGAALVQLGVPHVVEPADCSRGFIEPAIQ